MSDRFEAVLRPGWRQWLALVLQVLLLVVYVVTALAVCLFLLANEPAWFDWLLAGVVTAMLGAATYRGVRHVLRMGRGFLRRPYPVTLIVDRHLVRVMSGMGEQPHYAEVAWEDVVAVVASRAGGGRASRVGYVQFVPRNPAELQLDATQRSTEWKARALRLDPAAAALAWLAPAGTVPGAVEAVARIRLLAPAHVRFLDSLTPGSSTPV